MPTDRFSLSRLSLFQKIFLIFFGLLISLILLEAGLRLGGFALSSLQEYRNKLSLAKKGSFCILCLGESTTAVILGHGPYPNQLEEILNEHRTGINCSVINKGVVGINTSYIIANLETNLNRYHPDMVITMMGVNDDSNRIPYEIVYDQGFFFKSFKIYKLARLLWAHASSRAEEIRLSLSGENKKSPSSPMEGYIPSEIFSMTSEGPIKKAIELNPKDEKAYETLGWYYVLHGNYAQLEKLCKKAVQIFPNNVTAYLGLGACCQFRKDYSGAEFFYKKVLKLNPKNAMARSKLEELYTDQKNLGKMEEYYKKALRLNPYNDQIYVEWGWFVRNQANFSEANALFNKALRINPDNDGAYAGLGDIAKSQGNYPEAEALFKKAIELNPKNTAPHVKLGEIYRQQNNFSQAEILLKQAIAINPQEFQAYGILVALYRQTGQFELAEVYSRKVNELSSAYYNPLTAENYRKLKVILDQHGIQYVCVQYPMRSITPLKRIFEGREKGIILVDNENVFKEALHNAPYEEYFLDRFGGDFGHCTRKGNRLLAENVARTILKEYFHKN